MPGPYRDAVIALGTIHGKERAIARPFARRLGAALLLPDGIDTDAYGTFTGEIERYGTMVEAARAKAQLAIERTGLPRGLASEGSFQPHPLIPGLVRGTELVLFLDRERDLEIRDSVVTQRTNYASRPAAPEEDVDGFLGLIGFPRHALVVTPHRPIGVQPARKGIADRAALAAAIAAAGAASFDGRALLVTDMRAHLNPTRMAVIRAAADRLARRIATPCPACARPGFGLLEIERGQPCAACGGATALLAAEIDGCVGCGHRRRRPRAGSADPRHCPQCNP
ncbi:MAG: DUF6671 family protein [Dongiaceae bacterium]